MNLTRTLYSSPIGVLEVAGTADAIVAVNFVDEPPPSDADLPPILRECVAQLDAYFRGELQTFTLNLQPQGTPFQRAVWRALTDIPFAQTASYADIARRIERPRAFRAVGNANGQNPISIIVPCHRVIGSDGSLTGYGGGLWRKEWLLAHERRVAGGWHPPRK